MLSICEEKAVVDPVSKQKGETIQKLLHVNNSVNKGRKH